MEAGGALLIAEVEVVNLNIVPRIVEGPQVILGNSDRLSAEVADDFLDDRFAGPTLVTDAATDLGVLRDRSDNDDAADTLFVDQLRRLNRPDNRNRDVVGFAGVYVVERCFCSGWSVNLKPKQKGTRW